MTHISANRAHRHREPQTGFGTWSGLAALGRAQQRPLASAFAILPLASAFAILQPFACEPHLPSLSTGNKKY